MDYLTLEKLDELKKELEYLKGPKRMEVAERLGRAKELGDLSENSEYQEAREEQNQVETKIGELESLLKQAVLIEKSSSRDAVSIGSTVHVKRDGKTLKFTIVGSNESRPEDGLISNESPLGRSFLNKKVGDVTNVETPSGKFKYEIMNIE